MKGNLLARVARLETELQQQRAMPTRWHRFIQEIGEAEATARSRYEQEARLEIDPADLIIVRRIVDTPDWRTA